MNLWTAVSAAVGIKTPTTEKQREGEKVVAMSVEYSQKSLALKGKKIDLWLLVGQKGLEPELWGGVYAADALHLYSLAPSLPMA